MLEVLFGIIALNYLPANSGRLIKDLRFPQICVMVCGHMFNELALILFELRIFEVDLNDMGLAP